MADVLRRKQFIIGVQLMFAYILLWMVVLSILPTPPLAEINNHWIITVAGLVSSSVLMADGYIHKRVSPRMTVIRNQVLWIYIANYRDKIFLTGSVWCVVSLVNINMDRRDGLAYMVFFATTALIGILLAVRDSCIEYHTNKNKK